MQHKDMEHKDMGLSSPMEHRTFNSRATQQLHLTRLKLKVVIKANIYWIELDVDLCSVCIATSSQQMGSYSQDQSSYGPAKGSYPVSGYSTAPTGRPGVQPYGQPQQGYEASGANTSYNQTQTTPQGAGRGSARFTPY